MSKWWRVAALVQGAVLAVIILGVAPYHYSRRAARPLGCQLYDSSTGGVLDDGGQFLQTALKFNGTDKVFNHHYEAMYAKYLDGLRGSKVAMLEIGLGCNMPKGPGHSVELWRTFFGESLLDYYVIEYDPCFAKWRSTFQKYRYRQTYWMDRLWKERVFWGDQADVPFLREVSRRIQRPLDVILDDGGHSMVQQQTSFEELFPLLRPGGVYIIEDLETSFYPDPTWGGTLEAQRNQTTTVGYMCRLLTDLSWRTDTSRVASSHYSTRVAAWVRSIDCDRSVCVITKRKKPFFNLRKGPGDVWPCTMHCVQGRECSCS